MKYLLAATDQPCSCPAIYTRFTVSLQSRPSSQTALVSTQQGRTASIPCVDPSTSRSFVLPTIALTSLWVVLIFWPRSTATFHAKSEPPACVASFCAYSATLTACAALCLSFWFCISHTQPIAPRPVSRSRSLGYTGTSVLQQAVTNTKTDNKK